ncbi:MAG: NADPH-dependent F420 reductase [Gemmatimonadota bacterium]
MRNTAAKGRSRGWRLLMWAAFGALGLSCAASELQAQDPPAIAENRALTVGLIGAGNMGGPLGQLLAAAGHQVVYSSRNPAELIELVQSAAPRAAAAFPDAAAVFADVVILAVPPSAIPQLGEDIGHLLVGKVVIDITNPRLDRDGPITNEWLEMGTGMAMAQYLPGARMVKAFNTLGANMLGNSVRPDGRIGVPIAGDDPDAVAIVTAIVRDAGFDPVVVGPLARAKDFDRGTPVWVTGMTGAEVREALGLPPGT